MTRAFTDGEMRSINRCRLFLQVEYLSDVCTADDRVRASRLSTTTQRQVRRGLRIPSADLLMDQAAPDSLTTSGHSWSNLATTGCPSEYAKEGAAPWTDLCPQRNRDCPPSIPLPFPRTVASEVSDPPPRTPYREQNCSRDTLHHYNEHQELVPHRRHK
jgi:hypothetical protein